MTDAKKTMTAKQLKKRRDRIRKKIHAEHVKGARICFGCHKPLATPDHHHQVVDLVMQPYGVEMIVVGLNQHQLASRDAPRYQTTRLLFGPKDAEALSAAISAKAEEVVGMASHTRWPFPASRVTVVACEGQDDDD